MNKPKPFSFTGYAREYGTFVGFLWTITFVAYAQGIQQNLNSFLILLSVLFMLASMVLVFMLAYRFRTKLPENINMKYFMSYIFSLQMLMFACLFSGLLEFCYLTLIDKGQMIATLHDLLNQSQVTTVYRDMGMSDVLSQIRHQLEELAALTPLQLTLLIFNQNFMMSLFFAAIVALIVRKKNKQP